MTYRQAFGWTLVQHRQRIGMNQYQMAESLGVSDSYLSLLEHGNRDPPFRLLTKIPKVFNMKLSEFIKQIEEKL